MWNIFVVSKPMELFFRGSCCATIIEVTAVCWWLMVKSDLPEDTESAMLGWAMVAPRNIGAIQMHESKVQWCDFYKQLSPRAGSKPRASLLAATATFRALSQAESCRHKSSRVHRQVEAFKITCCSCSRSTRQRNPFLLLIRTSFPIAS